MRKYIKTKYLDGTSSLVFASYHADNSIAVTLHASNGERLATATTCLVDYGIRPTIGSNILVKDYSENAGMYEALKAAGVVGEHVFKHEVGAYKAAVYECPLTQEALDECTKQFHARGIPVDTRMDG